MTISDAAKLYGYNRHTLLDAIKRGALPAQRLGPRAYVVEARDVEAYRARTGGQPGRPEGSKDSRPSAKRGRPRKHQQQNGPEDAPTGEG